MNALEIQTLACGAYGWFQQALIRLCVCVAVALFAVLILRTQAVRDAVERIAALWRGAAYFTRLAVLTLLSVCILFGGDKMRNGGGALGDRALPECGALGDRALPNVTAEEIAQGWRLESVVTNDAVSYVMPTNGVEYMPWSLGGGYEAHFPLDLGDFAFPFGTNVVRRVDVVSGGMVESLPRQLVGGQYSSTMSICAAREYASIVSGVGRFWWADTARSVIAPYQAKLLTWENVYAGRDRMGQYNAQIEFHDDGNFITRSNNVERVYRRINPNDWDGDGLANEIDPNPCSVDGDFFGVANAMPEGANQDAYYLLDICVTGALDCATVRVTCDGPSALGDHVALAGGSSSDTIQIQRQADVLYYSGHGSHDTGVLNGVASPSDVSNHWHDVDTVVFAGCSVLDIGDKVGHYPDTTTSHSASPGLRWISTSEAGTLLGYAYKAPRDEQGAVGIIGDWCAMRSSTGDVEAWMKANDKPAGRNACAIRVLGGGRIEYRYFRRVGRGWTLRSKYAEIVEEMSL